MAEEGQAWEVSLCPGHTAAEKERTEVGGAALATPAFWGASLRTEGPEELDGPADLGGKASSGYRAWGCWHTKLVWFP